MGAGRLGERFIKIVILKVEGGFIEINHNIHVTELRAGCMRRILIKYVLLMKMTPNDWNRSWSHENYEFLLDMCSTDENDDSSTTILND